VIVADTHAWLWWASDPDRLSPHARSALDAADRIGVCTISAWEIGMLAGRRRIALDRDVRQWVAHALAAERVEALPLTADVAVAASLLEDGFVGDPADRIIYATARARGALLATKDERLRAFDAAATVW
jgi:PIN domain nuclease of toxin-antitoxin system